MLIYTSSTKTEEVVIQENGDNTIVDFYSKGFKERTQIYTSLTIDYLLDELEKKHWSKKQQ